MLAHFVEGHRPPWLSASLPEGRLRRLRLVVPLVFDSMPQAGAPLRTPPPARRFSWQHLSQCWDDILPLAGQRLEASAPTGSAGVWLKSMSEYATVMTEGAM